jgi:hypothetical protein
MPQGSPGKVRDAVLTGVRRELAASRWDRRLGRLAAVLLIIGVGMNVAIGRPSGRPAQRELARAPSRESLTQVAVTVAEATDAQTGSRFARQLAALAGWTLSREESAAIDAAIGRQTRAAIINGNEG